MIDNRSLVLGVLATDAFTIVNKRVLRCFSGDGTLAIILCELISIYKYMISHHSVDELDSFPLPVTFLYKTMNLSEFKQKRVLRELQARGLVIVTKVGMPASRRVALDFDAIARILDEEAEKEYKQKEKSKAFYNELNSACNTQNFSHREFHAKLDNIREPLAGCMFLTVRHFREKSKSTVDWNPSSLGAIKSIVMYFNKEEAFDYGRFIDALKAVPVRDFHIYISELFNVHKSIPERSPDAREYRY